MTPTEALERILKMTKEPTPFGRSTARWRQVQSSRIAKIARLGLEPPITPDNVKEALLSGGATLKSYG